MYVIYNIRICTIMSITFHSKTCSTNNSATYRYSNRTCQMYLQTFATLVWTTIRASHTLLYFNKLLWQTRNGLDLPHQYTQKFESIYFFNNSNAWHACLCVITLTVTGKVIINNLRLLNLPLTVQSSLWIVTINSVYLKKEEHLD